MAIKKRIILAAGHGVGDPGAVAQNTTEYIENIQITDLVAHYLREAGGFEVHVVPHTLNLVPSIQWVNARWGNLLDGLAIEIHKNAGGGTGSEVWTPSHPDATARKFSQSIADHLAKETGLRNRGVKEAQNNRWGRLGWCDDVKMYACLVEAGFIDVDPVDDRFDKKYARGIANGILAYFGSAPAKPTQPATPPASNTGKKSNEEIAREVLAGKWGNNPERQNRLTAAGYNYAAIQAIVNAGVPAGSAPAQSSGGSIKVGSTVTVSNPVDWNGTRLSVSGNYSVMELKGSRAVIGRGGAVTAAINVANLRLVGGGGSSAPAQPAQSSSISVGNSVVVTNPVDVNGTRLGVSGVYTVMEVSGNRVVIGRNGQVTAAINKSNLRRA